MSPKSRILFSILLAIILFASSSLPTAAETSSDQAARAILRLFEQETDPQGIQRLAIQIADNYSARKLLKTQPYSALGAKYADVWKGSGNLTNRLIERTKAQVLLEGYPRNILDRICAISNSANLRKAPMDFDIGIMSMNRADAVQLIKDLQKYGGTSLFLRNLQTALNKSFVELANEIDSTLYIDPRRAFVNATTAFHPEAYLDPKVLTETGVASEQFIQQTADVSKYKANEMRGLAREGIITMDDAIEEIARGGLKDYKKVERVFDTVSGLLDEPIEIGQDARNIIRVFEQLDAMQISPAQANQRIIDLTDGRWDIWTGSDCIFDQMESAWRLRKKGPKDALLSFFADFLEGDDYDRALRCLIDGDTSGLPRRATELLDEAYLVAESRFLQLEPLSLEQTINRISGENASRFAGIRSNPRSEGLKQLILKVEESGLDLADLNTFFGAKKATTLREIAQKLTQDVKQSLRARFLRNRMSIADVDQSIRSMLANGKQAASDLGNIVRSNADEIGMGVAMGLYQTYEIMQKDLTPDEEYRQVMNAWGTSLPMIGDIAQGINGGIEWYYDENAPASKFFKSAAWVAIGTAGVVPGGQAYAIVGTIIVGSWEVSDVIGEVSKDKAVMDAWYISSKWNDNSRLVGVYDKDARLHELSLQGLFDEGDVAYISDPEGTTIRESLSLFAERNKINKLETYQSFIRALKKTHPDFPFMETMRETVRVAKPLFYARLSEVGESDPYRSLDMLMFTKAKKIYDAERLKMAGYLIHLVEDEYQARHRSGEAREVYDALEALSERLNVPLVRRTEEIFNAFSNFMMEMVKTPFVREGLVRRRVMLAEKYLRGYILIERQLESIREVFEIAGVRPPPHNLTGYLDIDMPRIEDLATTYPRLAITQPRKDVQALLRELSEEDDWVFNPEDTTACGHELFQQLAGIQVRIIDATDRKLMIEQWAGKKSAATATRDRAFAEIQDSTETIPQSMWGGLTDSFESAYAWTNMKWQGGEVYDTQIEGLEERIATLEAQYEDALFDAQDDLIDCIGDGDEEVDEDDPDESEPVADPDLDSDASEGGSPDSVEADAPEDSENTEPDDTASGGDRQADDQDGEDSETTTRVPAGNGGASGGFPSRVFNGMQVSYNVTGASMVITDERDNAKQGVDRYFTESRTYSGRLGSGMLTVSGSARMGSGYGARLSVNVRAGNESKTYSTYIESGYPGFNSDSFSLSVPIGDGVSAGSFQISMSGDYSMGGSRGVVVSGSFADENSIGDEAVTPDVEELKVQIKPAKEKLSIGEKVRIRASIYGGSFPYDCVWTNATGGELSAEFVGERPGVYAVSLAVTDAFGSTAVDTAEIEVMPVEITLSGVPELAVYGDTVTLTATTRGDVSRIQGVKYSWQSSENHIPFNPEEGTSRTSRVQLNQIGRVLLWVALLDGDNRLIAESAQAEVDVRSPAFSMKLAPTEPYIDETVTAEITSTPALKQGAVTYRWIEPSTRHRLELNDPASKVEINRLPAAGLPVRVEAISPHDGESLGVVEASIPAPKLYGIEAKTVRQGVQPRTWKPGEGLVELPRGSYGTDQRIHLSVDFKGRRPESAVSWHWSANEGTQVSNPASRTPTVARTEAGNVELEVKATNNEGLTLAKTALQFPVIALRAAPTTAAPEAADTAGPGEDLEAGADGYEGFDETRRQTADQSPRSLSDLAGQWFINGNGYEGMLTINPSGTSYVNYKAIGRDEALRAVSYDAATSTLTFSRPIGSSYSQIYTGTFDSDGKFSGKFVGGGTYSWWAKRIETGPPAASSGPQNSNSNSSGAFAKSIEGEWQINANNYKGTLTIRPNGESVMSYSAHGWRKEVITNLVIDDGGQSIQFDRPISRSLIQHYSASMDDKGQLVGSFTSGSTTYKWKAWRE
jgi:hypothetical protein